MELKRELEISEDSIGSLQAKLENLSSQREGRSNSMCHTSRTESTKEKACADYPFGEDTSKDGSSAASFAIKKGRLSCSTSNFVDSVSIKENELKMDLSVDSEKQEGLIGYLLQGYASFKKKRSKRKRRIFAIAKRSRGDNEMTTSPACMDGKETLDRKKLDVQQPSEKSYKPASGETSNMVMRRIMDSIMDYKDVSQFQQKLVNQKKANYKKLIRQHVDFPTIKSRIGDGSITSNRELFRDLLLLSNNALVFYPKNSLEHKSALSLLEHVKKIMRENTESHNCRSGGESGDSIADPISAVGKPKKGASIHQCNHSTKRKLAVADEGVVTSDIVTARKAPQSRVPVVYQTNKRGTGRPVTSRADGAATSLEKHRNPVCL